LRRLLALLLVLAVLGTAALAEGSEWTEDGSEQVEAPLAEGVVPEQVEAPLAEGVVPEQAEAALPVDGEEGSPALDGAAIAAPADVADGAWTTQDQAAVAAPADPGDGAWATEGGEAAVSAPVDLPPVLSVNALTIGRKQTVQLALANGADPASLGAAFSSSAPKIVEVDAATGVVKGKKEGTATVACWALGVESTCTVTVIAAPKKIELPAKKLTLALGEEAWLTPTLTPGTLTDVTFTSDSAAVAILGNDGHIVATCAGKAKVTARTSNGKKASCKLTVVAAPEYVALPDAVINLWQGRRYELKPVLSPGSGGGLCCVSSDPGIVAVDGMSICGMAPGAATVTVTTYNGLSASATVLVNKAPVYRALLVGESNFPGSGMGSLPGGSDADMMARMLSSVGGASGSAWAISRYTDLTAAQLHDAIRTTFAGAAEGDVSLFYISSHGDQDLSFYGDYPEYVGYLMTYPDDRFYNWYDRNAVTLVALAAWLGEVPGQVVVLIDSCGSGAAIYSPMGTQAGFDPESFDSAVVDAFRDQDRAVMAPGMDRGAFLVQNKFFVLTSAAYRETGWSLKNKYSYFAKWLTDAIKTKGRMPADADKNHVTTLNELYTYMRKKSDKKVFKYAGESYRQHVQVYPAGSGFELFYR